MSSVSRVVADERGLRATFDEIEIGAELPRVDWVVTEEDIDACCMAHDDYHEWYSIDSPFGGRVAPPFISYVLPRETMKLKYRVRGLFVGWISEQLDVIRPNRKMTWHGRITEKYVKRDREWLWYEWTCTDEDGRDIVRTKRGHVMDFLSVSTPKGAVSTYAALDDAVAAAEQYAPPVVRPKVDIVRLPGSQVSRWRQATPDTPLGTELAPASTQLSLRYSRDYYELMLSKIVPHAMRARNIHTDPEIAKQEGLGAPNSVGPQCAGGISRIMLAFLGEGWLKGGRFDIKLIKQIPLDDFLTAKGVLTSKVLEGDNIRLACDVWVEDQTGRKVIVGRASGLIPA